jgi:tetratricopeptide (TPR) repeat protein
MRPHRLARWCGAAVLLLATSGAVLGQVPQSRAAAGRAARAGRYTEARTAYRAVLAAAPVQDSAVRAEALFGEAFATQQLLVPDSGLATDTRNIVNGYLAARSLDSARLYAPASNNAGVLLRSLGDHAKALALFRDAAAAKTANRPLFLLNAGREFEALRQPDSAAALYRQALASDSSYGEARAALLTLYRQSENVDSLIAAATRWHGPDAIGLVNDAILRILTDTRHQLQTPAGQMLLILFGRNLAEQQPEPRYFTREIAPRLSAVADLRPFLKDGARSLIESYQPRKPGNRYAEPGNVWWQRHDLSVRGEYARMAPLAWSSILRGLGDRYMQGGDLETAASYYEAALDFPRSQQADPRMDLSALMPLGIIYVTRAKSGDSAAVERLNRFVGYMFYGKGDAYESRDLRRIRAFHMALGELFARQEMWGTPSQVRGAIFQLERMRMLTRAIQQEDPQHPVTDPPGLLEHLAEAYRATGQPTLARGAAVAAREAYLKAGLTADAERMTGMIADLGSPP